MTKHKIQLFWQRVTEWPGYYRRCSSSAVVNTQTLSWNTQSVNLFSKKSQKLTALLCVLVYIFLTYIWKCLYLMDMCRIVLIQHFRLFKVKTSFKPDVQSVMTTVNSHFLNDLVQSWISYIKIIPTNKVTARILSIPISIWYSYSCIVVKPKMSPQTPCGTALPEQFQLSSLWQNISLTSLFMP